MKRVAAGRCAASGLLLLSFLAGAEGQQRTIAWRLDEGQQFRVRLVQTTTTRIEMADKATTMSLVAAMEMRWRVQQVDADGRLHLMQTFSRLYLQSAPADMAPMTFDSASPEPPPAELHEVAAATRPLLASRFVVTLSPRGEIVTVEPTAETESLLRDVPAYAAWKNLLTVEGMNRTLRQALGVLPAEGVQVGDLWRVDEDIDTPTGRLRISKTYSYDSSDKVDGRALERITATATILTGGSAGAFDPPQRDEPNQCSTYQFDATAGHLVQSRVVQTLGADAPLAELPVRIAVSSTLVTRIVAAKDGE